MIKNVYWSSCEVPAIRVRFNERWISYTFFEKKIQVSNLIKTRPMCHLQHKLIGFYNPDEKCLQRGTDWVFK